MNRSSLAGIGAVLIALVALVALGAWYWQRQQAVAPATLEAPPVTQAASAPPSPMAEAASGSAIKYPIAPPAAVTPMAEPASAPALDVESALAALFGRKSVLGLFQVDDFARRVTATVDNLGRSHAASRLWPVNPAGGRFLTDRRGDSEVISADNGLRYTPYVLLMETVDLHQLAAVYRKLYPLFQAAYEDLGYPGRYFNDRLVEVLDQLLATPDAGGPLKVRLPAINGPAQPPRPWVLYEFEDPTLQSLSAGQKILLRTAPVNERRLKAKLAELRGLLASGAAGQ